MKPDEAGSYDPSVAGDPAEMMAMMGPFFAVFGLVILAVCVFMLFCYAKIFSKAGYSGWLCLLMLVPIANFVLFIWFAFADWPVVQQARGGASKA